MERETTYKVKKKCSVLGCHSEIIEHRVIGVKSEKNYSKLYFFSFPKNDDIRKKWILFCGDENLFDMNQGTLIRSRHICEKHFSREQLQFIISGNFEKRLKKNVIPHLCPANIEDHNLSKDLATISSTPNSSTTTTIGSSNGNGETKTQAKNNGLASSQELSMDGKMHSVENESINLPENKVKSKRTLPDSESTSAVDEQDNGFVNNKGPTKEKRELKKKPRLNKVILPKISPSDLVQYRQINNNECIGNKVNINCSVSVPVLKDTNYIIGKPMNSKAQTIPVIEQTHKICDSIDTKPRTNTKEQSNQNKSSPKKKRGRKSTRSIEERLKSSKNIVKSRNESGTYYTIQSRKKRRIDNKNECFKRIFIDDVMEALHDILPPFLRICLEFQLCKFRQRKPVYQYQMRKLSATLLAHMGRRAYEVLTLMTPLPAYRRVRRNMENPKLKPDIELFKMDSNKEKRLNMLSESHHFRPEDSNYRCIRVDHSDEELSDEDIDEDEGENEPKEDIEPLNWLDGDLEDELDESEEEYQSDDEIVVQFNIPQENMNQKNTIYSEANHQLNDILNERNTITIKQEDIIETFIEENNETSIIYPECVINNDGSYHKPRLKEVDYSATLSMPFFDFDENEIKSKNSKVYYKSSKNSCLNYENR